MDPWMEQGEEKDRPPGPRRLPRNPHFSSLLASSALFFVQCAMVGTCFYFFNELYRASPLGACGLISSSLAGLSQGILQLLVFRAPMVDSLLKFHVYGTLNGIYTSIGTPFGILLFFTFSAYWENYDVAHHFDTHYWSTLRLSYLVWPLASFVNFYYLPIEYMVPFNAVVNLIWTLILGALFT